ncbi:sarcosine oxidase subunit gamma [Murinocardiopsis flavida]|uniref:Sarcosine oxidase subunit gamma n=1 Tax=Murinocardiopsis flavida TaxID=645275 RepID=A0A2P8DKR2_9ACTN|nr:sarcosine oxidase subunit gamma family protein [Murinocardiopsis flavida]PSK97815.1 sarcosine oxidase subunit gamma [Murinocardiopsis flavida]
MTDERTAVPRPRPERRSPIAHLADRCAGTGSAATVRLREVPFPAQAELRVSEDEEAAVVRLAAEFLGCPLPGPGSARGDGSPYALWCGPGWYLVVDSSASGPGLAAALECAVGGEYGMACGSVTDVSAQRTVLELSGPHARDVLAHGCMLDLHPRVFGPGGYTQTLLAGAAVGLQQTDAAPTYRVLVRAAHAEHLTRWLLDAMTEYAE